MAPPQRLTNTDGSQGPTALASGGVLQVPNYIAKLLIDYSAQSEGVLKLAKVDSTNAEITSMPVMTGDLEAFFYNEGTEIPEDSVEFYTKELSIKDLGLIVPMTNQFLRVQPNGAAATLAIAEAAKDAFAGKLEVATAIGTQFDDNALSGTDSVVLASDRGDDIKRAISEAIEVAEDNGARGELQVLLANKYKRSFRDEVTTVDSNVRLYNTVQDATHQLDYSWSRALDAAVG